jgi:hypothetical protein
MPISCPTIKIIDDFNINMFDQNSTQPNGLEIFYGAIFNGTSILKKLQQFMDPILITYGRIHPLKNACRKSFECMSKVV